MYKKMRRYKGLILSCLSVMMLVVSIFSFSFESSAANVYYVQFAEPSTSNNQGYVVVEIQNNSTGKKSINTFFWSSSITNNADTTSFDTSVDVDVSSGVLSLTVHADDLDVYGDWFVGNYNASGGLRLRHNSSFTSDDTYSYSFGYEGYSIVGFYVKGNVGNVNHSISYNMTPPEVVFNSSSGAIQLQQMVEKMAILCADNDTIILKLTDIVNNTDSVENKLQSLIDLENQVLQEQKKSNTWLEKIWNSIQEILNPDEESKEESDKLESETNDKTDKLDDLNEQNKTDKTDIDSAANSVDENVDLDSIDNYGKVLSVITENQYILQILLLVFSVALVAYVLFGKK